MTTYAKVKETLVSLEGAKATVDTYGQIVQDKTVRNVFRRSSDQLERVIERLKKRLRELELEEPQYRGF
jgi:hypothetical protein